MKEKALTGGGLGIDSFSMRQEVSTCPPYKTLAGGDAIVLCGNEPRVLGEVSQTKEGQTLRGPKFGKDALQALF